MSRKVPAGDKPMLQTERLALRPLSSDEVDFLHRISNEPKVRLYLWDDELVSEATIKSFIAQSDRMLSGEKIGMKYLGNINPSAREEPYFALSREDFFAVTG
jgi:RimJ/RimL family protein N-acetyltransferase